MMPADNCSLQELERKDNILACLPKNLRSITSMLSGILQASDDVIATTLLSSLASISGGCEVLDSPKDDKGIKVILYTMVLAKSGGGKTGVMRTIQRYLLDTFEKMHQARQAQKTKRAIEIQTELESLGSAPEDRTARKELKSELENMTVEPDVYLEEATQEGLELSIRAGSSPLVFLDNFGIYLDSKSNTSRAFLRQLDNIYDDGRMSTRRIKQGNQRSEQISVASFGLHMVSTVGESNLKPAAIKNSIANGFLNKAIICFQDVMDKDIPLRTSLSNAQERYLSDFALKYAHFASKTVFVLSDQAKELYEAYHASISREYTRQYNNDDDGAGYTIRQLNLAIKIACIFEITTRCSEDTYEPNIDKLPEKLTMEERRRTRISRESMSLSIAFLSYIKEEHISKIMLYANSKDGKIDKHEIVYRKALDMIGEGKLITARSIVHKLSKGQREKVGDTMAIKAILSDLVAQKRLNAGDMIDKDLFAASKDRQDQVA